MTPKQQAFVNEYLKDLNATAAAIRAKYSQRTAAVIGLENLRKPLIAAAITAAKTERSERTKIDADWVLRTLAAEKMADMSEIYADDGSLKPIKEWPMVFRTGLVAGIETVQERDGFDADGQPQFVTVRKVKLADRTRLLELIGKHVDIGAFEERSKVDAKLSGGVMVTVAAAGDKDEEL